MITEVTFNRIYTGLANQGWAQSVDPTTGVCLYRGPNRLRCAIGHAIDDNDYRSIMDTPQWPLKRFFREDHPIASLMTYEEARELQHAHDTTHSLEGMKRRFDILRNKWFPAA